MSIVLYRLNYGAFSVKGEVQLTAAVDTFKIRRSAGNFKMKLDYFAYIMARQYPPIFRGVVYVNYVSHGLLSASRCK